MKWKTPETMCLSKKKVSDTTRQENSCLRWTPASQMMTFCDNYYWTAYQFTKLSCKEPICALGCKCSVDHTLKGVFQIFEREKKIVFFLNQLKLPSHSHFRQPSASILVVLFPWTPCLIIQWPDSVNICQAVSSLEIYAESIEGIFPL